LRGLTSLDFHGSEFGDAATPMAIATVLARGGGNPLFVEELAIEIDHLRVGIGGLAARGRKPRPPTGPQPRCRDDVGIFMWIPTRGNPG
jgi:hypothetical protein